jgi:hypothetical protein
LYSDSNLANTLKGVDLRDAENYVLKTVRNQAIDYIRRESIRKTEDIDTLVTDPHSWGNLDKLLPESEQDQILDEIRSSVGIDRAEDVALYFQLMLDGFSDVEITKGKMLPYLKDKEISEGRADGMLDKYKRKIREVLVDHFDL